MKVLLDECLPRRLKRELSPHQVFTVPEMGWAGVKNGALLRLIQTAAFDVFVTIDGNLEYQQNLKQAHLAIIDGALIGGAALDGKSYGEMVRITSEAYGG